MTDHRLQIREFLSRFFRLGELKDDDDIFALAFVNSLFAMQLILWVEKEFGVSVGDKDLRLSNFNSVTSINAFVARKAATIATAEG
jgi:methoxymalonate biosynthesis acyl carrier protein